MKTPGIFFDRDGIVNRSPGAGYVLTKEAFFIQDAFVEALRMTKKLKCKAAIITNQRCVGKGLMTLETLEEIHAYLKAELQREELEVDGIFACTTADPDSELRKPKPGLFFQAERALNVDLQRSWMIGDRETDVTAGRTAGCKSVLVCPEKNVSTKADIHIYSVNELPDLISTVLASQKHKYGLKDKHLR